MNFSISVDHMNKIIRYKHWGVITRGDIGAAWLQLLQLEEFTAGKYNLLSDYSDGKYQMATDEVNMITNHLAGLSDILNGKKQAIIICEATSTAITMIFEGEVIRKVGFIVQTFSTVEAGLRWLTA